MHFVVDFLEQTSFFIEPSIWYHFKGTASLTVDMEPHGLWMRRNMNHTAPESKLASQKPQLHLIQPEIHFWFTDNNTKKTVRQMQTVMTIHKPTGSDPSKKSKSCEKGGKDEN